MFMFYLNTVKDVEFGNKKKDRPVYKERKATYHCNIKHEKMADKMVDKNSKINDQKHLTELIRKVFKEELSSLNKKKTSQTLLEETS